MNDLDMVRTLRADVPSPAPACVAAGRNRLLAAIAQPSPRVRHPWRVALVTGAVAATAAVATVAVLASGAHPSTPQASSRPSAMGGRISLAAQVLKVAADKVASEPASRPPDDQWIYSKFIQTQTGQATQSNENWIQFDGRKSAYFQDGQLTVHDEGVTPTPAGARGLAAYDDSATPLTAYNALASLPSNPATILTIVGTIVGTTPRDWENWASGSAVSELAPKSQGQAEFDYLAQLLWNAYAAAPPAAQANVYRAMADIPGVIVHTDLTNAVDRTAIGVSANGGVSWLLLDPQTYHVTGINEKAISIKSVKIKNYPLTFSGTISMAWADVAPVSRPGAR
jgi:hypothetical protein